MESTCSPSARQVDRGAPSTIVVKECAERCRALVRLGMPDATRSRAVAHHVPSASRVAQNTSVRRAFRCPSRVLLSHTQQSSGIFDLAVE
jgi:hypothetical protein